ncbi:unnamed protein product [Lathyrus sativus]|nr:unnamed protein product [Lathyrus sativus]
MEFVAPKIIDGEMEIQIEEEDVEKEVKFWESALIMYALGVDLRMNAVKQFLSKNWNFVKLPDMFYNEEGFFILRFQSFQDKDLVLIKGSYSIRNRPMMLREWKPDFSMNKDMMRTVPLWVKLPQLPLHLWGAWSLSKIGSALGTPLVTDECTTNKLRVSYARILVEIDITQELKTHILIRDEKGARLHQPIEYEWKPLYCQHCQKMGHNCDKPIIPAKEWKMKVKDQAQRERVQATANKSATTATGDTSRATTTIRNACTGTTTTTTRAIHKDIQQNDEVWTMSTSNGKGKAKISAKEDDNIQCQNGFGLLGILNDPGSGQQTDQC